MTENRHELSIFVTFVVAGGGPLTVSPRSRYLGNGARAKARDYTADSGQHDDAPLQALVHILLFFIFVLTGFCRLVGIIVARRRPRLLI